VIDRYIESAIAEAADTVLNLGAGLDARPYRMDLPPSVHWIEADYARLIEHKENLLAADIPRCWLERVKIDLADAAQRRRLLSYELSVFYGYSHV
jgi:O-methyltransferase involved in polyketide biosynthesis